ncbi:p12 [Spodoptera frugiperda multiple nucleopolyhedrovirus]|uniref:p12 n=1 Tax=Spodoptera frugiperda nuclear polyhedrosis virus TaxID=10455 RepID=A1YJ53_NPVSF|nr:p12 [Spodoptera frugiperda multiple nucleopolyhedrovirus]ABM45773.1 p12 [Spodoptera frugiperda multiple nucleopolyhedrovirus]ACA02620.1 P12 [Spodoptera frugiperda multiple nucleopolyhedrovirus]ADV91296.1 p12 [Spodoptera frugiperda multiple nucleopolyhedrovirus]AFH59089.1 p12 [Spodoptera frugiperda multiple nucleopolyhedrovirus]AIW01474.1 P12 protein [Spodoptera frugiperda multiple nucleopolyhedrovirus]
MSTRRRYNRSDDTDDDEDINANQLLQNLNETHTVADLILNDTDHQKRVAIGAMSRHSAIAKTILDNIDEDESLRLGTVNTINVLKLMSDIYDNKIPIVNNQ